MERGDIAAAVKGVKRSASVYALSKQANPPAPQFVNTSGLKFAMLRRTTLITVL